MSHTMKLLYNISNLKKMNAICFLVYGFYVAVFLWEFTNDRNGKCKTYEVHSNKMTNNSAACKM